MLGEYSFDSGSKRLAVNFWVSRGWTDCTEGVVLSVQLVSCAFSIVLCLCYLTYAPYSERERDVVALVVSVESEDEIAICWSEFGAAQARPRYVRYKGRNISSETREHLLRRPFGWTP